MEANNQKYFIALELLKKEKIIEFHKAIDDPVFSLAEKKILHSRFLLRERKWDEVIEGLNKITSNLSPFLLAEKEALFSYSFSMKGEWQKAIIHNSIAISIYHTLNSTAQLYNAYYNTSVYFSRLGLIELSNYYLEQSQPFSSTEIDKLSINLALAANHSKLSNYSKAIAIIESGLTKLDDKHDFDFYITYNLVASDIFCRSFKYRKAISILDKLISVKKTSFRGRILFEYELIKSHLNEDYSLIKWPDAVLNDSIYSIKAKVIDYLLTGQTLEAKKTWITLANKEPNNYLPNFEMKFKSDENSLYFVFIKKIQSLKLKTKININTNNLSGKNKLLFELLHQAKFPVSKEDLIEKIWDVPYDPKYDSRFYKLVQRLKEEIDCEIKNNHGGYLID